MELASSAHFNANLLRHMIYASAPVKNIVATLVATKKKRRIMDDRFEVFPDP